MGNEKERGGLAQQDTAMAAQQAVAKLERLFKEKIEEPFAMVKELLTLVKDHEEHAKALREKWLAAEERANTNAALVPQLKKATYDLLEACKAVRLALQEEHDKRPENDVLGRKTRRALEATFKLMDDLVCPGHHKWVLACGDTIKVAGPGAHIADLVCDQPRGHAGVHHMSSNGATWGLVTEEPVTIDGDKRAVVERMVAVVRRVREKGQTAGAGGYLVDGYDSFQQALDLVAKALREEFER